MCHLKGLRFSTKVSYIRTNRDFLAETVVQLQVAGKLGVRSLRGQTLAESSDYMQLGVHSVEAFGQSEALTTRLKHIISDYAAGPGILMELLQNADDAGASEVAFLLDEESYGTSSILGEGRLTSVKRFCSPSDATYFAFIQGSDSGMLRHLGAYSCLPWPEVGVS